MLKPAAGTYYRSVTRDPPKEADFRSHAAKGKLPPTDDPDLLRQWQGLSVFDTLEQARANRRRFRHISDYIAELRVPEGTSIRYEGPDHRGHGNLYGASPDELLTYVTSVFPFAPAPNTGVR